MPPRTQALYVALLLGVTAVWGWTFVVVKDAISQYPVLPFLAIRFLIATVAMLVLVRRLPSRRVCALGALIGLPLAAGYLLQTAGLRSTSPGNAGLITGLFFVFTPLLDRLFGVALRPRTLLAVLTALVGTVLLTGAGKTGIGAGDLLVLGCAVCFALQIVMLSHWSPGLPAAELTLVQLATSAALFTAGGIGQFQVPSAGVWTALLITGLFASALAFFIQTWVQSHLSASRTALVLAGEPGWALFFSVLLAGQRLGPLQAAGAALVLAAIAGHELPLPRRAAT
ncbi:MAG: DMT family transporter [Candidatus Dormibacteraeota bacterium]|jgi:drug/metabolite transporter (DMT)-like permease|nr:DMT family transporter [Candidatus Dormibacteraeota bacterium]